MKNKFNKQKIKWNKTFEYVVVGTGLQSLLTLKRKFALKKSYVKNFVILSIEFV